jgi:hypothetical protein
MAFQKALGDAAVGTPCGGINNNFHNSVCSSLRPLRIFLASFAVKPFTAKFAKESRQHKLTADS